MLSAKKELFTPSGGGYQISRSVRLRNSASAYLNRTPASASDRRTWTYSGWVKRGLLNTRMSLMGGYTGTTNGTLRTDITILDGAALNVGSDQMQTATDFVLQTTQLFRDPSAWYHIVVAMDTTQATSTNRVKIYVNGVQVTAFSTATYPSLNYQGGINFNNNQYINRWFDSAAGSFYGDGYLTEVNFIDGQALTPSSFGETNALTGVWQPKRYAGTYGTNGFYLNFSDNSGVTATTIGKDYSGNGNNWTPSAGISITAGVTYDSMLDVPTPYADGGTGRGNYAVGNPLAVNVTTSATATLTNGNLLLTNGSATYSGFPSTMSIPVTGKWAWKFKVTGSVSGSNDGYIGFACNSSGNPVTGASSGAAANWFTTVQVQAVSDRGVVHKYAGGSVVTDAAGSGGTGATGDEWEFLIDRDAGTTIVKINGTTKATVTGLPATQELFPFATFYQTSGYFIFDYTPSDTSYKTLNTQNLPTPTISNGATVMAATLYTGNDPSTQTITNTVNGVSFQPDLVWVKSRSNAYTHVLVDSVRGVSTALFSNLTNAEVTEATRYVYAFNSNGFSVKENISTGSVNATAGTYVGWQWNAGGSTVTNTNGSISSQVRANPTAGFSVVTYTGNGLTNQSVGHGLNATPGMVIIKQRDGTANWLVHHQSQPTGYTLYLNLTNAQDSGTSQWGTSAQTSSLFYVGYTAGATGSNVNASTYVAYCFAAVAGYSAFGKYTGNGSTDGPFVYTGFRPRWVMIKCYDVAGEHWIIYDTARNTYNVITNELYANLSNAEATYAPGLLDVTANGFKLRYASAPNVSGRNYIYAAFAENPFKHSLAR